MGSEMCIRDRVRVQQVTGPTNQRIVFEYCQLAAAAARAATIRDVAWSGQSVTHGPVVEQAFTVMSEGRSVPGLYWQPDIDPARHLILLGHGGTTHKKADYIELIAHLLVRKGLAAMAIDGPGHGERETAKPIGEDYDLFAELWETDGGTAGITADWSTALDFIEGEVGQQTIGWWGVSMGTMMGVPFAATDSRVQAAVMGLMGNWGPNKVDLMTMAPDVLCPLRFLVQWDDEMVPTENCIELFDKIGSAEKSMHVNQGLHAAIPPHEVESSLNFLDHHLSKLNTAT